VGKILEPKGGGSRGLIVGGALREVLEGGGWSLARASRVVGQRRYGAWQRDAPTTLDRGAGEVATWVGPRT
jgi:hypothetical protein